MKIISTLFFFFGLLAAQLSGQCSMACNGNIVVTLPVTGATLVETDWSLIDAVDCNPEVFKLYRVSANGERSFPAILERSDIGNEVRVVVEHEETQNSCWTEILVEDHDNIGCTDTLILDINWTEENNKLVASFDVINFENIASMQFTINYDAALLSYNQLLNPGLDIVDINFNETATGKIRFVWFNNAGQGSNLSAGSALFQLEFDRLNSGDASIEITSDEIPIEFSDALGNLICIDAAPIVADGTPGNDQGECVFSCGDYAYTVNVWEAQDTSYTTQIGGFYFLDTEGDCDDDNFQVVFGHEPTIIYTLDQDITFIENGDYPFEVTYTETGESCTGEFTVGGLHKPCTLLCGKDTTFVLGQNEETLITLDIALQDYYGSTCDEDNFMIELRDDGGFLIEPPIVTTDHIGQNLEVRVTDIAGLNWCWHSILVAGENDPCDFECIGYSTAVLDSNNSVALWAVDFLESSTVNCDNGSFLIEFTHEDGQVYPASNMHTITRSGRFDFVITNGNAGGSCTGEFRINENPGQQPCTLTCNDEVYVSLDQNGEAAITYDMILEGDYSDCNANNFRLELFDEAGDLIDPNILNQSHLGQEILSIITDTDSGNKCWGTILLEDFVSGCNFSCISLSTALLNDNGTGVTIYATDFVNQSSSCLNSDFRISFIDDLGEVYPEASSHTLFDAGEYQFELTNINTSNTCNGLLRVWGGNNSQDCIDTISLIIEPTINGDELIVDIVGYNFNNVATGQFTFNYDPSVLVFEEMTSALNQFGPGNFSTPSSGKIGMVWFDNTGVSSANFPDGTSIFTLKFKGIANANTELYLSSNPVGIEFSNHNAELFCINTNPENISVEGSPDPCTLACLDEIKVNISLGNHYLVTPNMVLAGGIANYEGCGEFEVEVTNPDGSPLATSPNINFTQAGQTYNYTVTQVASGESCWGSIVSVDSDQTGTGANGPCVDTVYMDVQTQFDGELVKVDLLVYEFDDILSMQFAIGFDGTALEYHSFGSSAIPDLLEFNTNQVGDFVNVAWNSPSLTPVTLADGTSMLTIYLKALQNDVVDITVGNGGNFLMVEIVNKDLQELCLNTSSSTVELFGAHYYGHIIFDENENCILDSDEVGFEDWFITLSDGTDEYHFDTDETGYYSIIVPAGTYTVTAETPNHLWEFCENEIVATTNDDEFFEFNFLAVPQKACTYLTVDISTPFLRRCFDNIYFLEYCNDGTTIANDAYVEVLLDDYLEFVSTDATDYDVNGQLITFYVGDVAVADCGRINFQVDVSCDAVLGQTHCSEANIYPVEDCSEISPDWSGANLKVNGTCDGDSVKFSIYNAGDAMDQTSSFIVIEEDVMTIEQSFLLEADEQIDVAYESNGNTFRVLAYQVDNHPSLTMPSTAIEACGTNDQGTFSTGFVTMFESSDADASTDIDCQENIGSFDPNDKVASPKGYREAHYIENTTLLEYKLRFQNTGTDTAFRVIVKDTLTEYLDVVSIELGASSHPYEFSLEDSRVLVFTFNNIDLVPEEQDELLSNGFVKFKIHQEPGNEIGTTILNDAAIFFDFNEPIITNETDHLIGENFIEIIVSNTNVLDPNLSLDVYPNPFRTETNVVLENIKLENARFEIYNILGKPVKSIPLENQHTSVNLEQIPLGNYFFKIFNSNELIATGKLIAQ